MECGSDTASGVYSRDPPDATAFTVMSGPGGARRTLRCRPAWIRRPDAPVTRRKGVRPGSPRVPLPFGEYPPAGGFRRYSQPRAEHLPGLCQRTGHSGIRRRGLFSCPQPGGARWGQSSSVGPCDLWHGLPLPDMMASWEGSGYAKNTSLPREYVVVLDSACRLQRQRCDDLLGLSDAVGLVRPHQRLTP